MKTVKERREALKPLLERTSTAKILTILGYKVDRNFKFSVRDERTPSVSIRLDGFIKDFGSGEAYSDVVAFIHEVHGTPLAEAVQWVEECLGVKNEPANS